MHNPIARSARLTGVPMAGMKPADTIQHVLIAAGWKKRGRVDAEFAPAATLRKLATGGGKFIQIDAGGLNV